MAFKMIKHIIKDIIRSITLKDIPIRITTVLYSTLLRTSYQMALKTIKKIITDTIRSITLKSIIKNLKNKFITKSKHDPNIKLATIKSVKCHQIHTIINNMTKITKSGIEIHITKLNKHNRSFKNQNLYPIPIKK